VCPYTDNCGHDIVNTVTYNAVAIIIDDIIIKLKVLETFRHADLKVCCRKCYVSKKCIHECTMEATRTRRRLRMEEHSKSAEKECVTHAASAF
jgi:hypothetical protein